MQMLGVARFAFVALGLSLACVWASPARGCIATDSDGDGIIDPSDICILVPSAPPLDADTDGDLFGNVCDPDFDNDLVVSESDLVILGFEFGTSAPSGGAVTDLDLDDVTGVPDLIIFRSYHGGPPGPSCCAP